MNILAFESSCDETAAAVVRDGRTVLSDAILSQADMHALYGGVVPEIASRKRLRSSMALPSRNTVPDTLESWPIMVFKMVDFPDPLGPMSVTILPRCTWRATSSISGLPW